MCRRGPAGMRVGLACQHTSGPWRTPQRQEGHERRHIGRGRIWGYTQPRTWPIPNSISSSNLRTWGWKQKEVGG